MINPEAHAAHIWPPPDCDRVKKNRKVSIRLDQMITDWKFITSHPDVSAVSKACFDAALYYSDRQDLEAMIEKADEIIDRSKPEVAPATWRSKLYRVAKIVMPHEAKDIDHLQDELSEKVQAIVEIQKFRNEQNPSATDSGIVRVGFERKP